MAQIKVKLFGVFRMDLNIAEDTLDVEKLADLFPALTKKSMAIYEINHKTQPELVSPDPFRFSAAAVYVNGERCTKKGYRFAPGDEVWILSPASGG